MIWDLFTYYSLILQCKCDFFFNSKIMQVFPCHYILWADVMILKMMSLLFSSWRRCIRFVLYVFYSYCYGFLFPCLGNKFFHLQMLSERFKQEKHKLEANLGFSEHLSSEANSAASCIFCPEILCRKSGFDSWQDTLPLIDRTSLFLDIMLLQKLSSFLLLDPKRLQLV